MIYTLLNEDRTEVVGVRIDLDNSEAATLLHFLNTEDRIKGTDSLCVPCWIRDQLTAIKVTKDRLAKGNEECTKKQN